MSGQVVVDAQRIPALFHKVLGHGGGRIGRNVAQPRRVIVRGNHHQCVLQCSVLAEGLHHLGDRRSPLANCAVNAGHPFASLVDDGVNGHGGFAGLAVAENQFPLPSPHRNQCIDGLDTRFQGSGNRGALNDFRRRALDRPAFMDIYGLSAIQNPARGINDPAQQTIAHRGVGFPAGGSDPDAGIEPVAVAQEHDAHFVGLQVDGHPQHAVRKSHQFLGGHTGQATDPGDAATDLENRAGFLSLQGGAGIPNHRSDGVHGVIEHRREHGITLQYHRFRAVGRPA